MNRMQELRLAKGINMKEAAMALGMPYTTYVNYEKGTREPNSEALISIAKFYETSIDYLLGKSEEPPMVLDTPIPPGFEPMPQMQQLPLIGRIACGDPITAEQNLEGYVSTPADWNATFVLTCRGDSMEPRIKNGDLVAIHKQPSVEPGEIAAVRIDGEATLKHVYASPGHLVLQAENPNFPPIVLRGDEQRTAIIEGKAVGLLRGL